LHYELTQLATRAKEVAVSVDAGAYGFQKHRGLVYATLAYAGVTNPLNHAVKTLLNEEY
jgi:hypothetical protein